MRIEELTFRTKNNRAIPARTASSLTRALIAEIDRRNFRYTDICELVGMHRNYLSDYKLGKRDMKVIEAEAVAEILGMKLEMISGVPRVTNSA